MSEGDGKRRSLGRGLEALLGGDDTDQGAAPIRRRAPAAKNQAGKAGPAGDQDRDGTLKLPIGDIRPGKYQPRRNFDEDELKALTASVEEKGVLQPILVRRHPEEANAWELIAGERRWLAAQRARLREIPAVVHDLSDRETLEVGIVENVQRMDLTPLEEGEGYKRLIDEFKYTQDDLSKIVGKSRSHVANTLRLLNLTEPVKKLVDSGALSAGHARALLTADNPDRLADMVVRKDLSVRETERLAQKGPSSSSRKSGKRSAGTSVPGEKDADTLALERDLEDRLGLKVAIDHRGGGGQIVISYASLEQLDDLLSKLRSDH